MTKWNLPGIPHKGWNCIDVYDLAEDSESGAEIEYMQCEMCGNEKIRYVHVMSHPDFSDELHVGCVCAEKMAGDYENPRKCESALKNKSMRRRNFNRAEWRYNFAKQTYSKKYKGEYITIMKSRYGSWGVFFANQRFWEYDGCKLRTMEEAEHAAFEIFEEFHTTQEERAIQNYIRSLRLM